MYKNILKIYILDLREQTLILLQPVKSNHEVIELHVNLVLNGSTMVSSRVLEGFDFVPLIRFLSHLQNNILWNKL
jgi:hypothetical protein